jgi:hypothetical protein
MGKRDNAGTEGNTHPFELGVPGGQNIMGLVDIGTRESLVRRELDSHGRDFERVSINFSARRREGSDFFFRSSRREGSCSIIMSLWVPRSVLSAVTAVQSLD